MQLHPDKNQGDEVCMPQTLVVHPRPYFLPDIGLTGVQRQVPVSAADLWRPKRPREVGNCHAHEQLQFLYT